MDLDRDRCYRAVTGRDARFDGVFFTAVRTTGIFCRPSCPARTPKPENVTFFPSAAAAQEAGYRACRRCRPDAAPGSPEWDVRSDTVGRAMRLIREGVVETEGAAGLAARLGYTARHVNRLLLSELGAGPLALARSARAHHARVLLETTDLPITDVAFAAGFASVRQFNDTIRAVYDATPTRLRAGRARGLAPRGARPGRLSLRLAVRRPFAVDPLLDWLAVRAVAGIESVAGGTYARTLALPHGPATLALTPTPDHVECLLELADPADTRAAVAACRALLDLDADPVAVDEVLATAVPLAAAVRATPGLRVPGHVDGYELAVRAVVGQQVSVAGARTTLARMVAELGEELPPDPGSLAAAHGLTHTFPSAETVADADPAALGMPRSRGETVTGLARAVAGGKLEITPGADREALHEELLAQRGIGPWTAGYVMMRGARDPDVLLATDLVVRRRMTAHGLDPATTDRLRPWRSYASMHVWHLPERTAA